jgi:hypothetical protein
MKTFRAVLLVSLLALTAHADPPAFHPPPATSTGDWVALLTGIARMHGVEVTDAEIRAALGPIPRASDAADQRFHALLTKIKGPEIDTGYVYGLDFADIDNDGKKEYVLWEISSGFLRDCSIIGVYRREGETLVEVPLPIIPPTHTTGPAMFDPLVPPYATGVSPFLSVDREGVTMRYVDGQNGARRRVRYQWKAGAVRALDSAPCTAPVCDTPSHF